jgi:GT2 family glycosyltransferase
MITRVKQLADYADDTPFDIVCVVNAADPGSPLRAQIPHGVVVDEHRANVGWVGGLHAGRGLATATRMAWLQDDLTVEPGWLDAMMRALDANPDVAMCGSRVCNETGTPHGIQAGFTHPGVRLIEWTHSDIGTQEPDERVVRCGWVPSGGSVVDLAAWDAVGGVDIRLFPLGWVDFDYCAHLRAHGYGIAHVADARIRHVRHLSTPGELAIFASTRNLRLIEQRWEKAMWDLGPLEGRSVPHDCSPWIDAEPRIVAQRAGELGSAMLVPFARHADSVIAELKEDLDATRKALGEQWQALEQAKRSTSWKVTAPLRWVGRILRGGKR